MKYVSGIKIPFNVYTINYFYIECATIYTLNVKYNSY